jgi:hypothetical protein
MQPSQSSPNEYPDKDNPALSKVIQRDIRTIIHLRTKDSQSCSPRSRIVDAIGLLTEHELTRVLQMLDAIQDKLGIVDHANSELADLETETRLEDVLAEIHRLQAIESSKR